MQVDNLGDDVQDQKLDELLEDCFNIKPPAKK
jgi:hypothetical protein